MTSLFGGMWRVRQEKLLQLLLCAAIIIQTNAIAWNSLFNVQINSMVPSGYDNVGEGVQGYTSELGGMVEVTVTPQFTLTGGDVVTLSASSSDLTEGVVSFDYGGNEKAVLLVWTAAMDDPLTFYVIGQQDSETDGDTNYMLTLELVAASCDALEEGVTAQLLAGADLTYTYMLMNYEETVWSYDSRITNDVGVNVTTLSTIATNSVTKAASVQLSSAPTGIVVFSVTSSNGNEGLVAYPSVLVFTPSSWDAPQYIYVDGTNADEGEDDYTLQLDLLRSDDLYTTGLYSTTQVLIPVQSTFKALEDTYRVTVGVYDGGDCTHTIGEDNDPCALTVALCEYNLPWSGCTPIPQTVLQEYFDGVDVYMSVLNGQMLIDGYNVLTIPFDIDGSAEYATYDVTVTPIDDTINDGDVDDYINLGTVIGHNVITGVDDDLAVYQLTDFPYTMTVTDNDGHGVQFTDDEGGTDYETGESGKAFTAAMKLKSKPIGTITVNVAVDNAGFNDGATDCDGGLAGIYVEDDGTYHVSYTYEFKPDDYDVAQDVMVKGCNTNDVVDDPESTYTVTITAAYDNNADSDYGAVNDVLPFTNADDDASEFVVTPNDQTLLNEMDETGTTFTFNVAVGSTFTFTTDVYMPFTRSNTDLLDLGGLTGTWLKYDASSADPNYIDNWTSICAAGQYLSCSGQCETGVPSTLAANTICDVGMLCDLHNNDGGECASTYGTDTFDDPVYAHDVYSYYSRSNYEVTVTGLHNYLYKSGDRTAVSIKVGPSETTDADLAKKSEDIVFNMNNIDLLQPLTTTSVITSEAGTSVDITVYFAASYIAYTNVNVAVTSSNTNEGKIIALSPASGNFGCVADTVNGRACIGQTVTFTIAGVDDFIDDNDVSYTVTIAPTMTYLNSENKLVTMTIGSATITATNTDNDTAGIKITQGSSFAVTSYKKGTRYLSDVHDANIATISFPDHTTYEKDREQDVDFDVVLTSAPVGTLYLDVATQYYETHPGGGDARREAIPVSTTDTGLGTSFDLVRTPISILDTVGGTRYMGYDDVTSKDGYMRLAFTGANWNVPQTVSIQGLDDLVNDRSVNYDVTMTVTATSDTDTYNGHKLTSTFTSVNNDTHGVVVYAESTKTAESYYDYKGDFNIYLTSEPKAAVLFVVSTSEASQSKVSPTVLSFNADNWYSPQTVAVTGIDDNFEEDDLAYTVATRIVLSNDDDYGKSVNPIDSAAGLINDQWSIGYIVYDDPTDDAANSCSKGQYGTLASNTCAYCTAGTYVEINGDKVNCRQCPPGTMGAAKGARAYAEWVYWDGTVMDPGCLPCPEGWYQPNFGQVNCLKCPSDKYCGPFAAFMAYDGELADTEATNMWSLIKQPMFGVEGFKIKMDEQGFQTALLVIMIVVVVMTGVILSLMRYGVKRTNRGTGIWNRIKDLIKSKDTFSADHLDVYVNKDGELVSAEEVGEHQELPGGLFAIGGVICAIAFSIFMIYVYFDFNTLVTQILLPVDEELLRSSSTQLSWGVTFLGFAGCAVPDGSANSQVEVTLTGFTYSDYTMSKACDGSSNLVVDVQMGHDSTVASSPKLSITASSKCEACSPNANSLYKCPNCAAAYTRGFEYDVVAQPLYNGDDNRVEASITPSKSGRQLVGQMFRGGEVTAEVALIQATYIDDIKGTENYGFRIQYSQSDEGGAHTYATNTSLCQADYGCYWDETNGNYNFGSMNLVKSSNLQKFFITDDSFIDAELEESVTFTMSCAISTQQLYIQLSPLITWLDLYGAIGGIFESTAAVFLLLLIAYERIRNPEVRKRVITAITTANLRAMSPGSQRKDGFGSPRGVRFGSPARKGAGTTGAMGAAYGRARKRKTANKRRHSANGKGGPRSPDSAGSPGSGDSAPPSPAGDDHAMYAKEDKFENYGGVGGGDDGCASPDALESGTATPVASMTPPKGAARRNSKLGSEGGGGGGSNRTDETLHAAVDHLAASGITVKVGSGRGTQKSM